ncbi:MAG: hypothetical protein WCO99_14750, partial [Planctomycetota bacterium]
MTVPVPADLFLGLVTHHQSRFSDAATEAGLVHSVQRAAVGAGRNVAMAVSDLDAWTPEVLP